MEPNTSVPAQSSATTVLPKIDGPISLLKSSWRLFVQHWKILVPIIILPSIVSYVGTLLGMPQVFVLKVLSVIVSIVGAVISIAMVPALVNAIDRLSKDQSAAINLKDQYRLGFKYFWSMILVGIISVLVFMGASVLFIIPAIVVWVYASLYSYTLVLDGKKGFAALTESYSLVRGRWWPVLGRVLFIALVMGIAWAIIMALAALVGAIFGIPIWAIGSGQDIAMSSSIGFSIIMFVVNLVASSVLGAVAMVYTYNMYQSLKEKRVVDVSTSVFKKWLVAFLVIGIITIPLLFFTAVWIVGTGIEKEQTRYGNSYVPSSVTNP